jgi:hypothetical protein
VDARKASLLQHFDESGITAAFLDPEQAASSPGRRIWRWR